MGHRVELPQKWAAQKWGRANRNGQQKWGRTYLFNAAILKINASPFPLFRFFKDIHFPTPVAQTVLQHHERLDGSGYPAALKQDQILLEARILCVADVVEAMASHRPDRPGLGVPKALQEISEHKGQMYDSDVVSACFGLFKSKQFEL